MRVTFLGTGTSLGVPVIGCPCEVCTSKDPRDQRLRSSVLIDSGEVSVVVDTGPDFRQQMLRETVRSLDAVILTHGHKDHTGGLDDIRSFNFLQRRPMKVYAMEKVLEDIRREFSYVFHEDPYPGVPQLDLISLENETFRVADRLNVIPVPVMHGDMPVLGFRFGGFSYITDANFIPSGSMEKLKESKVLVVNALQQQKHYSHFNLEEALELIEELKPEQAFLTHLGHRMGLHEAVNTSLPKGVQLAFDGLQITL